MGGGGMAQAAAHRACMSGVAPLRPIPASPVWSDAGALLRYIVHPHRYWDWKGHSIRYQHSGDSGEPILMVHGFGGNA